MWPLLLACVVVVYKLAGASVCVGPFFAKVMLYTAHKATPYRTPGPGSICGEPFQAVKLARAGAV